MTSASKPPDNQQSSGRNHVPNFPVFTHQTRHLGRSQRGRRLPGSPLCVIGSDTPDWEQLHCCKLVLFYNVHASQQIQDEPFLPFMSAGNEHRQRGEVLSCWASGQASAGDGERMTESGSQMELSMQRCSVQVRNEEKSRKSKDQSLHFMTEK